MWIYARVNMADLKCTFLIAATMALISIGVALQCYTCTTHEHGDLCVDPFNTTLVDLVECGMDPDPNDTAVVQCVKVIAHETGIVGEGGVKGIVATAATRGCVVTEDDSCTSTQGASSTIHQCYCDTDGCNAASALLTTYPTILVLSLLATMCFLYRFNSPSL